ncbi:hypothetical protein K504DRAFT_152283 [Pleomassaria siparia CBS 279.74]|uniref:Uncharacterized protein n=1 Tax=Pleomassaria siparia CBS 279.74 TaxID=1314801 RepID=A0A6G1KME0_9PLEO|nr:hypothetical protein K504DRAFT_152283 [Pleomassaria siparia CBS 279.74]
MYTVDLKSHRSESKKHPTRCRAALIRAPSHVVQACKNNVDFFFSFLKSEFEFEFEFRTYVHPSPGTCRQPLQISGGVRALCTVHCSALFSTALHCPACTVLPALSCLHRRPCPSQSTKAAYVPTKPLRVLERAGELKFDRGMGGVVAVTSLLQVLALARDSSL